MAIAKLILCASNRHLTAGVWYGTKLHFYEVFENSEQGLDAFDAFLKSKTQLNVYLIVDAVEEEYRLETLPHTTGSARKELLERKLNQFNRNNLFRTAHFIGQDKDKRKDDHFLFVALSNADLLQGWMSIIQINRAPLVGLYLLPMISQYMVQQMKLIAPNILLCERLSSGLRQTYLSNGRLRISRLAPMENVKPNQLAYFYLVEIEKTRLYLLSQRFIADHTEVQLVMPTLDTSSDAIGKSVSQEQGVECKIVDLLAYAKNSNIAPDLVAKHPELLHMQLLANGNVPDNLAPDQLTKSHRINIIRRAIYVAAMALTVFGLGISGYSMLQASKAHTEIQQVIQQTQEQQRRYEAVAKNFPITPIPSADLKVAADIAEAIKANNHTPKDMMLIISQALASVPEIGINRIRWLQTNNINLPDTEQLADEAKNNQLDAGNQSVATENSAALRQMGFVNAELLAFGGDYRAALNSVNRFVSTLKQNPKVEQVTILQEPVNVSSFAQLQGSTRDENNTERTPAVFKLKLVLKQANP